MIHIPNGFFIGIPKLAPALWSFLAFSLSLYSQDLPAPRPFQFIRGRIVSQFPFKITSGLITIPVRINDSRELTMYVDSGMSAAVVILFHKELIQETRLKSTQQILLGGAGGADRKPGILSPGAKVGIPGLEMSNQTLIIFDDSRATSEWQVDGIIGRTLFDAYLTHINFEDSTITLYDPSEAEVDGAFDPIPIRLDIGIPIIDSKINLAGQDDIPVRLVVDLGHRNALYFKVDDKMGIQAPPRTIGCVAGRGIQGLVSSKIGRLKELKLGSYSLKDIPTSFLDSGSNMGLGKELIDGNVGQLVLSRFQVILDYRQKRMFLIPNGSFGRPFEFDMAGLVLEQDRDEVYKVIFVVEDSPARESNILRGDRIVSINGKDARDWPYNSVRDLLRKEGEEIRMTLLRNSERFEVTLKLRRLI